MATWKTITVKNETGDLSVRRKYVAYFARPTIKSKPGIGAFQIAFYSAVLSNGYQKQFRISSDLFAFVGKRDDQSASDLQPGVAIELNTHQPVRIGGTHDDGTQLCVQPSSSLDDDCPSIRLEGHKADRGTFEIICDSSLPRENKYVVGIARNVQYFGHGDVVPVAVLPCRRGTSYAITPTDEIYVARDDANTFLKGTIVSGGVETCLVKLREVESEALVKEVIQGFWLNKKPMSANPEGQHSTFSARPDVQEQSQFTSPPPANAKSAPQQTRMEGARAAWDSGDWTLRSMPAQVRQGIEDKWDLRRLADWDIVFVIDNTESMKEPAKTGMTQSRWSTAREALCYIADVAATRAEDGVDLHFLTNNRKLRRLRIRSGQTVLNHLRNIDLNDAYGATLFAPVLNEILRPYVRRFEKYRNAPRGSDLEEPKPLDLIVLTDGAADDKKTTRKLLVEVAKDLDRLDADSSQVGIEFVQVGDDKTASKYLDDLEQTLQKEGTRNMVGTKTYSDIDQVDQSTHQRKFLEILLGAMTRQLDDE